MDNRVGLNDAVYWCGGGHEMTSPVRADEVACLEHSTLARRQWGFAINTGNMRKDDAHWNPVVGQYVSNDAEFRSVLAQQVDRESKSMNMDVKIATVDSRDKEGVAELHGYSVDTYKAEAENTAKAKRDSVPA